MKTNLPKVRPSVLANRRFREHEETLRGREMAEVFDYIYRTNLWGSPQSLSGSGSEDDATARLKVEIPALLRRLEAGVLLDIPCGDFNWLSQARLDLDEYIGADIVEDLVNRNSAHFVTPGSKRRFVRLDIIRDPLPRAGVVLCRDCLVHLTFEDIFRTFANLKRSGSHYLLTTTFTELESNADVVTGDWRPLNMQKPPFNLPPPIECLNEGCKEENGAFADKSLGLWKITDLPGSG